jgi:hypothetical protein
MVLSFAEPRGGHRYEAVVRAAYSERDCVEHQPSGPAAAVVGLDAELVDALTVGGIVKVIVFQPDWSVWAESTIACQPESNSIGETPADTPDGAHTR